jgi:hypothetical protein
MPIKGCIFNIIKKYPNKIYSILIWITDSTVNTDSNKISLLSVRKLIAFTKKISVISVLSVRKLIAYSVAQIHSFLTLDWHK